MRVIKPQSLGLLTRPYEFKRQFHLGVSVIAFMPVGQTPGLLSEQAMWPMLAEELSPEQALDAAIPKARAEFLATAIAHAPGGNPIGSLRVGVQIGQTVKTLTVFGDRSLLSGEAASTPIPFATMPLDWSRAYGGPNFPDNPLGIGTVAADTAAGRLMPVPNVIDPRQTRAGYRFAAGFGALDQTWPERARRAGTYDNTWLKEDFPGFARDIDWRFFNIAPADQQLSGGLQGDETYAFENLHPDKPLVQGRLPGLAPRCFVVRRGEPNFEEVALKLTTVWFFPHRDRLVLVHHGQASLAEEDASDIERIVVGADRAAALRPARVYHDLMVARTEPETAGLATLRDHELVPADWIVVSPPKPDEAKLTAHIDLALLRQHRRRVKLITKAHDDFEARGLDPVAFGVPPIPPPEPDPRPTAEEADAIVGKLRAESDRIAADARVSIARSEDANRERMASVGMDLDAIRAAREEKPRGPPAFTAEAAERSMSAARERLLALGPVPSEMPDPAHPVTTEFWRKAQSDLRDGYRRIAHAQGPARQATAERTAAIRRMIAEDAAQARAAYDLSGADLSWLDLSGVDLTGVTLDGADLTGASLAGAKLGNAVLAHARMEGCVLDGADLTGANLGGARLVRASLRRAVLRGAILSGADLSAANFRESELERAELTNAILAGADLLGARAAGVLFFELSLTRMSAPGIMLDGAQFIRCDLSGCDLSSASLVSTMFLASKLDGARLSGADAQRAVFVQGCSLERADLTGINLSRANLRETALPGARLDGATLEETDFSGADLTGASLRGVNGIGSRFTAAKLAGANFALANLTGAELARADLRGADLTDACVIEANMARVKLDPSTRVTGMQTTRMRFLPRHRPVAETST